MTRRMLGKFTFHLTKLQLLKFQFLSVQALWARCWRIVFFLQFCALERCVSLKMVRYAVKRCTRVLQAENGPLWLERSQHTCYAQKRLESNMVCFSHTCENIRQTFRFSHEGPQMIYPSVCQPYLTNYFVTCNYCQAWRLMYMRMTPKVNNKIALIRCEN